MTSVFTLDEASLEVPEVSAHDLTPRRTWRRSRPWRMIVLLAAGAYFLIPLYAGLRFSLENTAGHFSFASIEQLPSAPGLTAALGLSLRLTAVTIAITALLLVPTTIYVHLRLPQVRRVLEFISVLPIVIPPIILILGVLLVAPLWLKSSPYLLSLMYAILSMPFIYRSLDAGLSSIDLKTLTEASRSLGSNWLTMVWRVVLPNIRPAVLSALILTVALVFGEYTMASLDLWQTVPVWIVQFNTSSNGHLQIAASMLSLVGAWVILTLIVLLDRSQSRRTRHLRA